jgi:predicted phosphodiesterase
MRVRVLSDLHIGSRWGLWPPGMVIRGEPLPQSEVNAAIWQIWQRMNAAPVPDVVIMNGDILNGANPRERGEGVKAVEPDAEQTAAVEILAPLLSGKAHYWLYGTPYHEKMTELLARHLGAAAWNTGAFVEHVGDLSVAGHVLNIAHHPEGRAVLYTGTSMERAVMLSLVAEASGRSRCDVIIRSHWHRYHLYQSGGKTAVQTPGWQVQTPREIMMSYFRYSPEIGWLDLVLEKGMYPLVQPAVIRVHRAALATIPEVSGDDGNGRAAE